MEREKIVLIGNGMAGIRTIEEILRIDSERFDITVFGEESHPNYDRIQLSKVLHGDTSINDITLNDWNWYKENHITLYTGEKIVGMKPLNKSSIQIKNEWLVTIN